MFVFSCRQNERFDGAGVQTGLLRAQSVSTRSICRERERTVRVCFRLDGLGRARLFQKHTGVSDGLAGRVPDCAGNCKCILGLRGEFISRPVRLRQCQENGGCEQSAGASKDQR